VAGVAGNHDIIAVPEVAAMAPSLVLLDGDRVEYSGLTVGGVSGVIGDPARPLRRTQKEFLGLIKGVTTVPTSVLLMHEGPVGERSDQYGLDCQLADVAGKTFARVTAA
jgi:hypothetical protein